MTQQDDESRARIAASMERHKVLLTLLRDGPLAASFVTIRAAQEEIFGEGNIPVGGSGGTTKGDTDMTVVYGNSGIGLDIGGGGATVTVGSSGSTMAGAGGGVAGDVPRRKRTAMDELETRIEFGDFTFPDWMQEAVERAMELDSAEGGRAHTDAAFETITGLFERPCGEFIEALTWGVR